MSEPAWILLTGGTGGIGKEVARQLANQGHKLIITGRNAEAGEAVIEELRTECQNPDIFLWLGDLTELKEASRLADFVQDQFGKLDILINNAGGVFKERELSTEGFEKTFALNVLSPYLLAERLLPFLAASVDGRIVNQSSGFHYWADVQWEDLQFRRSYAAIPAYGHAKLCSMLWALHLQHEHQGSGISVLISDPGISETDSFDSLWTGTGGGAAKTFLKQLTVYQSVQDAARPAFLAATALGLKGGKAKYIGPSGKVVLPAKPAQDRSQQRKMARLCREWTRLSPGGKG